MATNNTRIDKYSLKPRNDAFSLMLSIRGKRAVHTYRFDDAAELKTIKWNKNSESQWIGLYSQKHNKVCSVDVIITAL
jgi:hypothetical protein